jgi:hypothetical protein
MKRARFKTRHFLARRKPLAVSKFGVNGSGRGKKDPGLGKRGPKKKRQVRRDNVRGFKVPKIRSSARKRLGEQTGPWLRSSFPSRRQDPEARTMEGGPTERASSPGYFYRHRRPPRCPPDGDDVKDGDSGMKNGSPDLAVQNREFFRRAMDRRAISGFMDRGGRSSLPCGERTKIESEIFGFFAGREASPGRMAGGKLQEIFAKEGTRFCGTKGSVKSGGNILTNLSLYLRSLPREIRNLWLKRGHVALGCYAIFFPSVTATSAAAIGAIIRTLRTRSI